MGSLMNRAAVRRDWEIFLLERKISNPDREASPEPPVSGGEMVPVWQKKRQARMLLAEAVMNHLPA